MDGAQTGDTDLYVGEIQLTKKDNSLIFKNEGTEDNQGAMNLTYSGFRTAIISVVNPMMMYDAMWVAGGALRHIDIETTPGTITHAQWPAAVSTGGQIGIEFVIALGNDVVARMLATSPEHKRDLISGTHESSGAVAQAGLDQWGNEFGTMNLDCMGLGGSAHHHTKTASTLVVHTGHRRHRYRIWSTTSRIIRFSISTATR